MSEEGPGLGVTEFILRLMAWLCLRNNDYRNSQMCIVTGPNQDIRYQTNQENERIV